MSFLKLLVGAWLALVLVVVLIAVTDTHSASDVAPHSGHDVVTDVGQLDMLEADQLMLQQMRSAVIRNMVTMFETDPMWTDPDMIRLQEENQAQLDRMIGKRPGQP